MSSVSAWDNASSSVDGDESTCMQTREEKAPWWTLDLGENTVGTIVGLYISAGRAAFSDTMYTLYFRVYCLTKLNWSVYCSPPKTCVQTCVMSMICLI